MHSPRCTAVKIALIATEVYAELLPMLLERVDKLKVGHPDDEGVDVTAVIDGKSADYIEALVCAAPTCLGREGLGHLTSLPAVCMPSAGAGSRPGPRGSKTLKRFFLQLLHYAA